MTADEFREIALSFPYTEDRSHMNHPEISAELRLTVRTRMLFATRFERLGKTTFPKKKANDRRVDGSVNRWR